MDLSYNLLKFINKKAALKKLLFYSEKIIVTE